MLSVTAICKCSTDADTMTTAAFVLGINDAIPVLKNFNAEAIFVTENMDVFLTDGLINSFEGNNNISQPTK